MLQNYLVELNDILARLNPYKAILFGSSVYGKFNDDSDIDLIVVLNNDEMPNNFDGGSRITMGKRVFQTFEI